MKNNAFLNKVSIYLYKNFNTEVTASEKGLTDHWGDVYEV